MKNLSNSFLFPCMVLILCFNIHKTIEDNPDKSYEECEKIRKLHPNYKIACNPQIQENIPELLPPGISEAFSDSRRTKTNQKGLRTNLNSQIASKKSKTLPNQKNLLADNRAKPVSKVISNIPNEGIIPELNDNNSTIESMENIPPEGTEAGPFSSDNTPSVEELIDNAASDSSNNRESQNRLKESNGMYSNEGEEGKSLSSGIPNSGSNDYQALANIELRKMFSDSLKGFKKQLNDNFKSLSSKIEKTYDDGLKKNNEMLEKISQSQQEAKSELEILKNNTKSIQENSVESQSILKLIEQMSKNQQVMTSKINNIGHDFSIFKKKMKLKIKSMEIDKDNDLEDSDYSEKESQDKKEEGDEEKEGNNGNNELTELLKKKLNKREKDDNSEAYKAKIISLLKNLSKN